MQSLPGAQYSQHGEAATTQHNLEIECDERFALPIAADPEVDDNENEDVGQHVADVLASIRRRREGVDPAAAQGRVYKRLRMRIRHDWTNPAHQGPHQAAIEQQDEAPVVPEPQEEQPTIPEIPEGEPMMPEPPDEQPQQSQIQTQLQTQIFASTHPETTDHRPPRPLEYRPPVPSSGPSASRAPPAQEAAGGPTHLEPLPHLDVHLPRDHLLLLIPTCRPEAMNTAAEGDPLGWNGSGIKDIMMPNASDGGDSGDEVMTDARMHSNIDRRSEVGEDPP